MSEHLSDANGRSRPAHLPGGETTATVALEPPPLEAILEWLRGSPSPASAAEAVTYQRLEVRSMVPADRRALRRALDELNQPGNPRWGLYVYLHTLLTLDIHDFSPGGGERFLPWHRLLLWKFEQEIRQTSAGQDHLARGGNLYIPYWAWSQSSNRGIPSEWLAYHPSIHLPSPSGSELAAVRRLSGSMPNVAAALSRPPLASPLLVERGPAPLLERGAPISGWSLPSAAQIRAVQQHPSFPRYTRALEGMHGTPHMWVAGGSNTRAMGNIRISPSDVLFWMHHAQVDRMWWNWQKVDRSARLAAGGSATPPPQSPELPPWSETVNSVLDITASLGFDYA